MTEYLSWEGSFSLLDVTECCAWWPNRQKPVTANPEASIQFLSRIDTASLRIPPCCCWADGLKPISHDNSYRVPCMLFPTETANSMLSWRSFLILYDEFTKQLSITFMYIEKGKLKCNSSFYLFSLIRTGLFLFSVFWREQCVVSQCDSSLKKIWK